MSSEERHRGPTELLHEAKRFFAVEVWRPALSELAVLKGFGAYDSFLANVVNS